MGMCSAVRQLQNLNFSRVNPEEVSKVIEHRKRHLAFCIELYHMQLDRGLYFLHEHPATARSWQLGIVQELMHRRGVHTVIGDMCTFHMKQEDEEGMGFIKKPTKFMTNAEFIARQLAKRCPGNHRHIQLIS